MWLNTQLASKLIFKGECAFDPYPYDENNQPIVEDWASQYCEALGLGGCPDNQECYDSDTYTLCDINTGCANEDNCNELFPPDPIPEFPSIYIQGGNAVNIISYTGNDGDLNTIMNNSFFSKDKLETYYNNNIPDIIPDDLTPEDIGCPYYPVTNTFSCWALNTSIYSNYYTDFVQNISGYNNLIGAPDVFASWDGETNIKSGTGYVVFTESPGVISWR
jgi:hypothetical protein